VAGAGRECLAPARQDDGPQQQRLHARREHGVPGLDGELAVPEGNNILDSVADPR